MAIGTTAAILGSAALGAGASVIGGRNQSKAAQQAANASQAASDQATAEQARQYNQSRQDMLPWQTVGKSALTELAGLYGLNANPNGGANASTYAYLQANPYNAGEIQKGNFGGPGDLNAAVNWNRNEYGGDVANSGRVTAQGYTTTANGGQAPATGQVASGSSAMNPFFASPDYQFRQSEQARALTARNAAIGIQDSGAAQKAAIQYSGNLASGEFNNYANRLSSLAGVGQTAAQNTAQLGQNYANAVGNIGMNNAQNLGSSYQQQGANSANMWGNLAGIGSGLLNQFGGASPTARGGSLWGLY